MSIEIKKALKEDVEGIVSLMRDFAEYEQLADYCEIDEAKLCAAMFDVGAFVEGLAAYDGEAIIAYALFYRSFASFRGERGFYLEDLYIDAGYRGKGIGEEMIRKLAQIVLSRGFERIDFQVQNWNKPAIGFYEKLGAVSNPNESHFKFSGTAFKKLAGGELEGGPPSPHRPRANANGDADSEVGVPVIISVTNANLTVFP